MAETTLEHAVLTVTNVQVFVDFFKELERQDLLDEAVDYLSQNGKREMFIDGESLLLLGTFLGRHPGWNPDSDPAGIFMPHLRRLRESLGIRPESSQA